MGSLGFSAELKRITAKKRWNEADGWTVAEAWRSSGLSAEAFAEKLGVSGWRVRGWARRIGSVTVKRPPRFVPVHIVDGRSSDRIVESPGEGMVQLELPGGLRIRFGQGVAPCDVAELVRALMEIGC